MKAENRNRAFAIGLAAGVAGVVAGGLLAGLGRTGGGETFVTSSADGRRAYLWTEDGGTLRFVSGAEADKGGGHDGEGEKDKSEHGKEDHGKPQGDEKGKPQGEEKGKGKGKK